MFERDAVAALMLSVATEKIPSNPFLHVLRVWDAKASEESLGRGFLLLEAANINTDSNLIKGDVEDLDIIYAYWLSVCEVFNTPCGNNDAGRENFLQFAEPYMLLLDIGLSHDNIRAALDSQVSAEQVSLHGDKWKSLNAWLRNTAEETRAEHEKALTELENIEIKEMSA